MITTYQYLNSGIPGQAGVKASFFLKLAIGKFNFLSCPTIKRGLEAARARGRKGGRRSGLSAEAQKKAMLAEMYYKEEKLGVD